jgi:hypothetical protein
MEPLMALAQEMAPLLATAKKNESINGNIPANGCINAHNSKVD